MKNNIIYKQTKDINKQDLLCLYNDAGWTNYTENSKAIINGISNSSYVLTAWNNNKLVGLLRAISDDFTILYIQDIIVLKEYKRKKIGTSLINKTLKKYIKIRQKILLTNDNIESRMFYESLGFESCDKGNLVSFVFVKT